MARKISVPTAKQSRQLRYYHRVRLKKLAQQKEYRISVKDDIPRRLRLGLKCKRYQAKKQGIPFELDPEWLQKQPMMCAITGQKFEKTGPKSPSFDQKIPGKGYTKENTQLICLWLNHAKHKWSEADICACIVDAADALRG